MTILLDLDGTLTDPRPGILASLRHALIAFGEAPPPNDQLIQYIGPPLQTSFANLHGTTDRPRIDIAIAPNPQPAPQQISSTGPKGKVKQQGITPPL